MRPAGGVAWRKSSRSESCLPLETVHLSLVPHSPRHLVALIDQPESFEGMTGFPAAEGLRALVVSDEVSPAYLEKLRSANAPDPWVHGFAIVHKATRSVIGSTGFKGPPDESGMVELAYGVVPGFQGHGYATEAAEALVKFAFSNGRVHVVRAHTLPAHNASTRVLLKCGFRHVGEVVDPEDGAVWRWERRR